LAGSGCCAVAVLDVVIDVVSVELSLVFAHAASASAKGRASDARVKFDNCRLE
jgi:hypothetical protein